MIPRLRFYIDKLKFLTIFIWLREWKLVKCEWDMTYSDWIDAQNRWEEINKEAVRRLWKTK